MLGAYVIQSLPCSNVDKPYVGVRMCSARSTGFRCTANGMGHWWGSFRITNGTDYCYCHYYYPTIIIYTS